MPINSFNNSGVHCDTVTCTTRPVRRTWTTWSVACRCTPERWNIWWRREPLCTKLSGTERIASTTCFCLSRFIMSAETLHREPIKGHTLMFHSFFNFRMIKCSVSYYRDSAVLFCHGSLYIFVLFWFHGSSTVLLLGNIVEHWAAAESDMEDEIWTYSKSIRSLLLISKICMYICQHKLTWRLKKMKELYCLIFRYICMFLFCRLFSTFFRFLYFVLFIFHFSWKMDAEGF